MKRLCIALALAVLLLLTAGVGTAMADTGEPAPEAALAEPAAEPAEQYTMDEEAAAPAPAPDLGALDQTNDATSSGTAGNLNAAKQDADQDQGSSGTQVIGQSAKSDQDALALALTVQKGAENVNAPVNVLSKGDSGDVTQENTATSDATAGNLNLTEQDADQDQKGEDCKCSEGGTQVIAQSAKSEQDAAALAKTVQEKPSNTNVSIRVLSPGDNGNVTQTNTATSNATAGNVNLTKQDADQDQKGGDCKCTDGGTQIIGQSADSEQKAAAAAATVQEKPSNKNISIRVLSDGDDGDVTQTNTATSNATAGNVNLTKQDADQEQAGSGFQFIGQTAENDQKATALAGTVQEKPSNTNVSIRVLSPGNGGSVTQSNTATSNATAGNLNALKQDADQEQGGHDCKCSDGKQIIGQYADSEQDATAAAATFQIKPSNTNTSIRVLSKGDDGDVTQSNTATSDATAANLNLTKQDADQEAGGSGIQVIGQAAKNDQDATALAATFQLGASNVNAPVRVLSKGGGGDVTQSNTASSDATAFNANLLSQDADQEQGGKGRHDDKGHDGYGSRDENGKHDEHDCCGTGIQVIGQLADNDQDANAAALTVQKGVKSPCTCTHEPSFGNTNAPVRVGSKGDDGDVEQSNTATSDADALNLNATKQDADQDQSTSCRCWEAFGIQVIGQSAKNDQDATALAATFQIGASNTSAPVSVGKGKGGRDHKNGHGTNHRKPVESR
jgi:ribosomal protein L24